MAEIIGREIEFGVATEATRGTAETAADKWARKVTANVVERAVHAIDDTTRGRLEDGEGRRKVQSFVEGSIEGIVHADLLGYFLANIYGVAVASEIGDPVYSHVFSLKQDIQHQSLTLFAKDGNVQQLVFDNAMINTLEITASIDDFVRFNAAFIASVATDNSDTPSYDTEYDFIAKDITVKVADTEGGLPGASAVKAKDLNVVWNQGLIRDHVVGSYTPDDTYNAMLMIEGSMTLNFADETYKDLYLGDSSKYMSITIQGGADLGGAENPIFELVMHKVQFMDWNRSGGQNELVTEQVSFRAFYNPTDAKQSEVTLQNVTTVYPNVPTS